MSRHQGRPLLRARILTRRVPLAALTGLAALSCASGFESVQSESRSKLYLLEKGMTREQVREVMGTEPMEYNRGLFRTAAIPNPWDEEAHVVGGESVAILYYVTNIQDSDGEIGDDELTPLVLVQGRLAGWGWPFLEAFEARIGLERVGPRAPEPDGG
jgi:hypothetical protein